MCRQYSLLLLPGRQVSVSVVGRREWLVHAAGRRRDLGMQKTAQLAHCARLRHVLRTRSWLRGIVRTTDAWWAR